jgi:RNA polymerase sigma-70 factor, ECF subfamily
MDTTSPALTEPQLTERMWQDVIAQLRGFVRRRIADPDRAEDLVGEILLRIYQNLGSLEDQDRLAHWVSRVARNAVIDEYRRAARAREQLVGTPTDSTAVDAAVAAAVGPDPEDESSAVDELSRCLRPLLAGLPPEQRRAVELIDLDGLPQAGAARREGVSLSGMKSRVQRGRRRLAELLGQCCTLTLDARGIPMDYEPTAGCDRSCGCS